jgi:dolichol kinase
MESKGTLDKVLLWADKHADTIIDHVFIIILLLVCWILAKPLFAHQPHEGFRTTVLISNIAFPLLRGVIGKKYKRLGGYLYGIGIVIIIIVFRQLYL